MPFYNKLNENIVVNNVCLPRLPIKLLSPVQLFVIPRTVAYQAPPSMEFSRKEYWNGLPFPSPGDLPNPGIKPRSPTLQADFSQSESPGEPKKTRGGNLSLLQGNQTRVSCIAGRFFTG